jgi:hypothetical protein
MGNAGSSNKARAGAARRWDWELRDGRLQPKARGGAAAPKRPLFRKQPSDNYNWWIFNPDPPRRTNSGRRRSSSSSRRGK